MDYFQHMQERMDGAEPHVPAGLGEKGKTRDFAAVVGVRTPAIHFRGTLAALADTSLPGEFVLKPAYASTSIGIYLLKKVDDKFENLLSKEILGFADIAEKYRTISTRYYDDAERGEYIVEQLLRDHEGNTPPQDIRVYAFQGEIGMILKEDHLTGSAAEAMYFDGSFQPMLDGAYSVAEKAQHLEKIVPAVVPENWEAILAVAKRVSVAAPTAFCRVDLYDTPEGVYLGEITFFPGTFYYRDRKLMSQSEADRLGRLWSDASNRLLGSL
ncbi:ATP-grasp fold amidoligase family protein [Arthrobacter sp. CAN_A212]|uniref:ATP-grasp fold amidoligase family protein n=1 Tax=Arthrobacter sp. CAN_A212 TaxID=2787719 RepID=UPI002FF31FE0